MKENTLSRLVALGLAITIPVGTAHAAGATTNLEQSPESPSAQAQELTAEDEQEIDELLAYIDTIPDDVVENSTDEQLAAYLQNNTGVQTRNAWECAGAIALILAGTVVPIAKVVNVVRLVKSLGGAKKAAAAIEEAGGIKKILATKGGSIKATDIRDGLLSLASELSGIGLAVEKC